MNTQYNTQLATYKESKALEQLLQAADEAMAEQIKRDERQKWYDKTDQFTITIGGVQTAFTLGGPQLDGLYAFVDYIAKENGYEVDFDCCTVKE